MKPEAKEPPLSPPAPSRGLQIDVRSIDVAAIEDEPSPRVDQELRIFISEAAFDRAVERGSADTLREVGGVLVGVVRRDESGPYVRVDTTIDALHAEEKGAELTFTHATWEHIHAQMDSVHQGKRVVGWYHTHPGFGVFLSDRDIFIHRSFFDLPFQIALVYDPKSRDHGVFAWRDGQPLRARRYWIGAHEHIWDGARTSEPAAGQDKAAAAAQAARPAADTAAEPRSLDWISLALGALVLILIGGLGGWWLGTRATGEVLSRAEVEIARAQARGARETVAGLNIELLEVTRAALGDDITRRRAEAITQALGRAQAALDTLGPRPAGPAPAAATPSSAGSPPASSAGSPPATPASTAPDAAATARAQLDTELAQARVEARALIEERSALRTAIERLRSLGEQRGGGIDARALSVQRNALGTLYADLADDALADGDARRAARYLQTAATVDPDNAARYEKKLRAFDQKTRIRGPGSGPDTATEIKQHREKRDE